MHPIRSLVVPLRRGSFLLCLCACLVLCPLGARALQISIVIDPGLVGESFASRDFDLPELVGLPIEDAPLVVDFTFTGNKFLTSNAYPGGLPTVRLELVFDPVNSTSVAPGPHVGGFLMDGVTGQQLVTAGFGTYGPSPAPDTLRFAHGIGPGRPGTGVYDRIQYEIDFDPGSVAGVNSQIRSAKLTFQDSRRFFPTEPLPHTVGVRVPEPGALMVLGLAALAAFRTRLRDASAATGSTVSAASGRRGASLGASHRGAGASRRPWRFPARSDAGCGGQRSAADCMRPRS